jgi:hypothetical protein
LAFYAQHCTVGEDLSWASNLTELTRAFCDVLFALSDPKKRLSLQWELSEHLRVIDVALEKGTRSRLVYRGVVEKRPNFDREPALETTPLSAVVAEWICDYLVNYSARIDLGACVECGKIFPRKRSDNAYCSKTCQNRVAYKRRKIFEGGLLRKIDLSSNALDDSVKSRVWAYHPRLGLGAVDTITKRPGAVSAVSAVTVIFPQTVRTFDATEIFHSVTDAQKIEFFTGRDAAVLAELV